MKIDLIKEINKMNIIIATPLKIDNSFFDRVINIEKNLGYSYIKEKGSL